MQRTQRILLLVVLAGLLVALAWWLANPLRAALGALNQDSTVFIQRIAALLSIASILYAAFRAVRRRLLGEQPPAASGSEPLAAVTAGQLRARLGRGGTVTWINRLATRPADLHAHPRLIITGRTKLGKTREAVELIARATADDVPADRVFEPGPAFQLLTKDGLPAALRAQLPAQTPLLLFLDDLPRYFSGAGLDSLAAALPVLDRCQAAYIVATARTEHLEPEHEAWLDRHGFYRVDLPDLSAGETGRLVDMAGGVYGLQVDDAAREVFVGDRDGTPERILASLRLLSEDDVTQVDAQAAGRYVRKGIADLWATARHDLQRRLPGAGPLFEALATFYAARVPTYTPLVLDYAAYLWRGRSRRRRPWRAQPALRRALAALAPFEVVVQDDKIRHPDVAVEGLISIDQAEQQLGEFLPRHRRLFHRPELRRLYPARGLHAKAIAALARNAFERRDWPSAAAFYGAALGLQPVAWLYYNRGYAYAEQGDLAQAIADYSQAIALDPQGAYAYNNRGHAYYTQGDLAQAIADYSQAIALDPQDAAAYTGRGYAYYTQGDLAQAIADYDAAIALDPQYAHAYNNRGNAYRDQGDLPQAVADYTQAIALDPKYAHAYNNRSVAYADQGDLAQAIADLQRARELLMDPADRKGNEDEWGRPPGRGPRPASTSS